MNLQPPIVTAVQNAVSAAGLSCARRGNLIHVKSEGHMLRLVFELIDDERALPAFHCRTTSWDFIGERSDLHDIISTTAAACMRANGTACFAMVDERNPAVPLDHEIYGRHMISMQPRGPFFSFEQEEALHALVAAMLVTEVTIWHLLQLDDALAERTAPDFSFTGADELAQCVRRAARQRAADALEYRREVPTWDYFHSARTGLTAVRCEPVAHILRSAAANMCKERQWMGPNGIFFNDGPFQNFVSKQLLSRARTVLRGVERQGTLLDQDVAIVPLEDRVVAASGEHVVSVRGDCGRRAFARARAIALEQQRSASAVLLGDQRFLWAPDASASRFEELVRELLVASGKATWIRSAGPTYDRDAGKDLVAEWVLPERGPVPEGISPTSQIPVVIQCKRRSGTVGKSLVRDIRDTVERHDASGYFLAVSSQLSGDLVKFLETLGAKAKIFVDWWTRAEIEDELRRCPDIASRYGDVIEALPLDGVGWRD